MYTGREPARVIWLANSLDKLSPPDVSCRSFADRPLLLAAYPRPRRLAQKANEPRTGTTPLQLPPGLLFDLTNLAPVAPELFVPNLNNSTPTS